MTSSPTTEDLVAYLSNQGWHRASRGAIGELWTLHDQVVGIPDGLAVDDAEWPDVIRRVGRIMERSAPSILASLMNRWQDVVEFTAPGASQPELRLGARLYACAYTAFRSSATTAQASRGFIRGAYSKIGDRLLSSVRFDQSREGSYIVPVIVNLDRPTRTNEELLLPGVPEPQQRRLTRTLQESLAAIDSLVIRPEHNPRKRDLAALVSTGVSRELVQSLCGVTQALESGAFRITTEWAPTVAQPRVASEVSIPKEAAPRLRILADFLRTESRPRAENVSGPIVSMDDDGTTPGAVIVQTVRNSRTCRVRVHLDLEQTKLAHRWFDTHETVIASGTVTTVPGDYLSMNPDTIQPFSDVLLVK